jgi:flagellar biosynthesis protein FlhB
MSDKTEQPTPRRLREAREQGDLAVSAALSQAVAFVVVLSLVPALFSATFAASASAAQAAIEGRALSAQELSFLVLAVSLPLVGAGALTSLLTGLVQSGGLFSLGRVVPRLDRLNPLNGLRGLFSLERGFGVLRALLAAAIVLALTKSTLTALLPELAGTPGELGAALSLAGSAAWRIARDAALVGLALGLLDLLVTRRAWRQRWMMTRAEVQRDFRESEGDPELKAARRRAHQEVWLSQQLGAVEKARVVIVNPTHFATALSYDEDDEAAPRIVAQGQGEIARRIIEAARARGVPIVRDLPVARALAELEVGEEIPEALYEAVAEILREVLDSESA